MREILWIAFDRFISRNARQDWLAKEDTIRSWHFDETINLVVGIYFKHYFLL